MGLGSGNPWQYKNHTSVKKITGVSQTCKHITCGQYDFQMSKEVQFIGAKHSAFSTSRGREGGYMVTDDLSVSPMSMILGLVWEDWFLDVFPLVFF